MEDWVPKFKKSTVGHVTLATPTLGLGLFIIHRPLFSTCHGRSNKKKAKSV